MLKEPHPGRVKTRLGRDIGMVPAAWWFRHQTKSLLRRLVDPRWRVVLAVSPDVEGMQSRIWPRRFARIAQGHGDLGARMGRIFTRMQTPNTCIIGADIPGITRAHVARAFLALGAHDAVLGPAPDGGYWLIGQSRLKPPPPQLFANVRWSTQDAMQDTLNGLRDRRVAFVDMLSDVDTVDDLPMTGARRRAT